MRPVDYDHVAPAYDRRYQRRFDGIEATIRNFLRVPPLPQVVVEVGCGTGHWLAMLGTFVRDPVGIDASLGMLRTAQTQAPGASLLRANAHDLPLIDGSACAVLCINAVHHFADRSRFLAEARRILRPGGGVLILGLDPHIEAGRWWIYEAFPSARRIDRERYPGTAQIRAQLVAEGFSQCATVVAEEIHEEVPFAEALERGVLDRRSTSQLMVIDDAEYEAGVRTLHAAQPTLHADLTLYATMARVS